MWWELRKLELELELELDELPELLLLLPPRMTSCGAQLLHGPNCQGTARAVQLLTKV